jgi:hypothetical protein
MHQVIHEMMIGNAEAADIFGCLRLPNDIAVHLGGLVRVSSQ